ncbi:type-F conjugative transfer system pilin assembly protein TrbC [Diaphorobacter nitroreducens]|uniref:type-F conjugative transfer system pilin assembly protein TrbC n=1 Tax=Diaphorobacter nitroreducens TaxID=164759 RepID=UPI000B59F5A6|nr:type-F conjugative transfer system pilin assembly protein TrbC [Diaphorobacter nitroreducens]
MITEEDIARARRDTPSVTEEDIRRAQRQHAAPVVLPAPDASPRIDALPKPLTQTLPDLSAIARGYAADRPPAEGMGKGPGLFVFASLAMPEAALMRIFEQAARAQASIVIRGLAGGSLRDTVARVQKLIGTRQVSVQIDPQAFDRYAVKRVPTFVLARNGERPEACASGACPPPTDFVSTAGDVSLDYALQHMRRTAPAFQQETGVFLSRLKR